jgi:hypothetical protein
MLLLLTTLIFMAGCNTAQNNHTSPEQDAYFGRIRTLIPATSGQHFGIIRTA